ncbi:MAG: sulfatase-like hydrolase/transferase, partial [Proteobacteria bacterium]|nr:sulfatase-like hydrolase/transferase [Candidatus Avisuccinivibrio stercorigallinarum]
PGFVRTQLWRLGALTGCLALASLCIFPFYQQYSFLGRDNKNMNKEILPVSYVYSAGRYALSFFDEERPYVSLGEGAYAQKSERPRLLFLILGETARAANFSALGYPRPTNQYSEREHVISYSDVRSCGTATAYSVPCMFSNLKRENYSPKLVENREGVLDVIKKAGYNVLWLDNDDGCKAVCDRVNSVQISPANSTYCDGTFCYDGVFIDYAKRLTEKLKQDTVIAFHFIGSHGPRYYERYPEEYRVFTPDCRRPDVEKCSREEVINAYDNSILYTDHVIYELIEVLESRMDKVDPMLLYISDHGESLGENGLYLHAAPYAVAPDEQTTIPLQLWLPDKTAEALQLNKQCLRDKALAGGYSHDNFFHSLLGLLQISAPEYEPGLDIFNVCEAQSEIPAAPLAERR